MAAAGTARLPQALPRPELATAPLQRCEPVRRSPWPGRPPAWPHRTGNYPKTRRGPQWRLPLCWFAAQKQRQRQPCCGTWFCYASFRVPASAPSKGGPLELSDFVYSTYSLRTARLFCRCKMGRQELAVKWVRCRTLCPEHQAQSQEAWQKEASETLEARIALHSPTSRAQPQLCLREARQLLRKLGARAPRYGQLGHVHGIRQESRVREAPRGLLQVMPAHPRQGL